ncbi:MAG: FIST N-terminal domain-containing protein [Pseudomonadota bacterium]
MKIYQNQFDKGQWQSAFPQTNDFDWILMFGSDELAKQVLHNDDFLSCFGDAEIMGCTTAGEIHNDLIFDETLCLTAVKFEQAKPHFVSANLKDFSSSFELGQFLGNQLPQEDLKYVFLLSDGHIVNGTHLINGLHDVLPNDTLISGGLAGDGDRFTKTTVWHNDRIEDGLVVVCAFYGNAIIDIHHGSRGGWDTFGPNRIITKSDGNVLYELDNQLALTLYKSYLGEFANDLPASALRFPLLISEPGAEEGVVRTILSIDEEAQTLTFAGDMPEGSQACLMRANFEKVIEGAEMAAVKAVQKSNQSPELAILISCVGRRLILKQRAEDEIEAARDVLNEACVITGFYSYGEISPLVSTPKCELHNQTMTITTFTEKK